jgi:hypothetical protein
MIILAAQVVMKFVTIVTAPTQSRGPQADRDRQLSRIRPGWRDLHRAGQRTDSVRTKGRPAQYSACTARALALARCAGVGIERCRRGL